MKSKTSPDSIIKQLVSNAQEARELAAKFSAKVEGKLFLTVFRRLQKAITAAAERGHFEARASLSSLHLKDAALPGTLAKLKELGFEASVESYETNVPRKGGKQVVKGLVVSFAPPVTTK